MKDCPPLKVLNPPTNRCVSINGKIGKQILKSVSDAHFKTLVLVLIFITGVVTLWSVLKKG